MQGAAEEGPGLSDSEEEDEDSEDEEWVNRKCAVLAKGGEKIYVSLADLREVRCLLLRLPVADVAHCGGCTVHVCPGQRCLRLLL